VPDLATPASIVHIATPFRIVGGDDHVRNRIVIFRVIYFPRFSLNTQSTIDAKGSSKALIDTGFLMTSVTQQIMPDHAYVGLLKTAMSKNGDSLAMIGAIMGYGATIQRPNGATIIIPPRPFLHPVMGKYRLRAIKNYREAVRSVMG